MSHPVMIDLKDVTQYNLPLDQISNQTIPWSDTDKPKILKNGDQSMSPQIGSKQHYDWRAWDGTTHPYNASDQNTN
mgnify:CR=1 FL=1